VPHEGVVDRREGGVVELAPQVDAADLGADVAAEADDVEMPDVAEGCRPSRVSAGRPLASASPTRPCAVAISAPAAF
jgi:hypothetical protein